MIQHVAIEIRPQDVEPSVEFWELLGFERVAPPESLAEFTWLERGATQIHLMQTDSPTVPPRGHIALLTEDFEQVLVRLREAGIEVLRRQEHWGAARAKATAPGGHLVELMAAPP